MSQAIHRVSQLSKRFVRLKPSVRLRWEHWKANWTQRIGYGSATLVGDRVYFFDIFNRVFSACSFNLRTFKWEEHHHIEPERRTRTIGVLAQDKVFIYGGEYCYKYLEEMVEVDMVSATAQSVETYGLSPGKRTSMSPFWAPWRREVTYFGGTLYHRNGRTNNPELSKSEVYAFDIDCKRWKKLVMKGVAPKPRQCLGSVLVGTKLHVYGCRAPNRDYSEGLYVAELRSNKVLAWSTPRIEGALPEARWQPVLSYTQNLFILFGGERGRYELCRDVELHLPKDRKWLQAARSSDVDMQGPIPTGTFRCYGISTFNAILYFTDVGVYRLTVER